MLGLFVVLAGIFNLWFDDVLLSGTVNMRRPFRWFAACFVFLIPAITMRLVAEEFRSGSIQIVGTLPVTPGELLIGKWLSAVALVAAALMLTLPYPLMLDHLGELDWGPVLVGYLGLLLAGAAFAAIGTMTSTLTDNQVIAFLLAAFACLIPSVTGYALALVPTAWVGLVEYVTFEYHFANLARGVVDTRSLVFFVTVCLGALRLGVAVLEHRRLA